MNRGTPMSNSEARKAAQERAAGDGIAAVLAAHVALGDEGDGITQCSCGVVAIWRRDEIEDSVRYLDTHAEGPDIRWHIAHVAAALRQYVEARYAR